MLEWTDSFSYHRYKRKLLFNIGSCINGVGEVTEN